MDRHFFEKRCHFSIRKFAIGAASVMIGASIFGANMVQFKYTSYYREDPYRSSDHNPVITWVNLE